MPKDPYIIDTSIDKDVVILALYILFMDIQESEYCKKMYRAKISPFYSLLQKWYYAKSARWVTPWRVDSMVIQHNKQIDNH